MLILAFDTALAACSVGVWRDGATLADRHETMERGQAEALAPLIGATIAAAGVAFGALERIAVTVGPGSFTGVRVGLAAARGFGLALGIPVIGVTTGAVLAHGAARTGTIISLIDSKRGDFYVEAFAPDGTALTSACVLSGNHIAAWIDTQGWAKPWTLVGDSAAAMRVADATVSDRIFPAPTALAELAAMRMPEPSGPVPLYVRPPDVSSPR
jgi:tRNA threonylcarbamoyladenosine biosynthesis protein TsaB